MPDINARLSGNAHSPADPRWKAWDNAWTAQARAITGRADLSVVVAPGAGGGAPACYIPALDRIEIDATYLGDPDVANPRRAAHKKVVPVGWGMLLHEAAHAVHSRWSQPAGIPPVVAQVMALLEESRCERRHRERHPRDRQYLRRTVHAIVAPGDVPVDDPWHGAYLAGLILARVDARILTAKDVAAIRATITAILGRPVLRRLRDIWRDAHQAPDDDSTDLQHLARRWCQTIGINPDTDRAIPTAAPGAFPGRLAGTLVEWLAAAAGMTGDDYVIATTDPASHARVASGHHGIPRPATWSRREPTPAERAAARRLSARIAAARTTHPDPTRTATALPPGRLHARAAISADAQRAVGATPTVQPWQRRTPAPPDKPRLRLAVLVDISRSMDPYMAPLSQAAWIFAHAGHGNDTTTATIAYGPATTLVTRPGQRPIDVLDMRAAGATRTFRTAITVADRLLQLRRRDTIRIFAVVSDGLHADIDGDQALITTLHHTGVRVLWLHPDGMPTHTFTDTDPITVAQPADAITVIGDALINALDNA